MYQDDLVAVQGETLQCSYKVSNAHDSYKVKVKATLEFSLRMSH